MPDSKLILPHDIEAEQSLLGAILLRNDAHDRVADFLKPNHFFLKQHGRLYELMTAMLKIGRSVTPVTLKHYVSDDFDVAGQSFDKYVDQLINEAATPLTALEYSKVIYDFAIRRDLIAISEEMAQQAYKSSPEEDSRTQIENVERKLYQLAETGSNGSTFEPFDNALVEAIELAELSHKRDGALTGLATGLIDLDAMMGGMQKSDLIILAGRPGMGKTALATTIGFNVAMGLKLAPERNDGKGGIVGFFSLEMSQEQLATRIIADRSSIPSSLIRRGDKGVDLNKIKEIGKGLNNLPLYIDQTGGLSIAQITARARRLKRQKGLDLLIVDYLQLMRGSSRRQNDNRVMEVAEITTGLKALAKELNIPILALSQLSRKVEDREDKRPQLSDLRESGSIEQDADVVLFVFREEYYLDMKGKKNADWQAEKDIVQGKADVIIGKQRHGPIGKVELYFDAELTRFSNLNRYAA